MEYTDHLGPDGSQDNLGGLTTRIWAIRKRNLDVIATVADLTDASVTDEAQYAVITDDHVPLAGKKWVELYNHVDKGMFEATSQGELGGKSVKSIGKGVYPDLEGKLLGFFRKAKNDQFIVLMERLNGVIIQLGSDRLSAYITATKYTTATNSSGLCSIDYEIEAMESGVTLYEGIIVL